MEILTHSKRSAFKNCHRYYFHRHVQHLERRTQKAGRRRGSLFGDALLEAQTAHEVGLIDDFGAPSNDTHTTMNEIVWTRLQRSYEEIMEGGGSSDAAELEVELVKVQCIVVAYIERYGLDRRREVEFSLPLRNPRTNRTSRRFKLGGKIDGVARITDFQGKKKATIIEDKLMGSIQRPMVERLALDHQTTEYVDAFMAKGWLAEVDYRITRMPGMNPKPAKEFKTKADYPGETLDEFAERLALDIEDNPTSYFYNQVLIFPTEHLDDYRKGRWQEAQDIIATEKTGRWYQNTSRCSDWGGCEFIPLCTHQPGAEDLYVTTVDNPELTGGADAA